MKNINNNNKNNKGRNQFEWAWAKARSWIYKYTSWFHENSYSTHTLTHIQQYTYILWYAWILSAKQPNKRTNDRTMYAKLWPLPIHSKHHVCVCIFGFSLSKPTLTYVVHIGVQLHDSESLIQCDKSVYEILLLLIFFVIESFHY